MESLTRCKNDHYYDNKTYRVCPYCVVIGEEDFKKTVPDGAPPFGGNNKVLDQRLVEANNGLGFNIFLKLAEAGKGQNLFISPASIIISLAIAYNGSAGDTRLAMEKTMQLEGMPMEEINAAFASLLNILQDPDLGVDLILANSLWAREGVGFNEDFLKRNQDYFRAKIAELNFNSDDAASIINKWVSSNTQNRIKGIVDPPINGDLILYLINAIYFKGQWTETFENRLTKENSFYLPGGSVKKHPTMFREGGFRYLENKLFQAVSLPYGKDARLSMYVFLPAEGIGLEGLYSELGSANWKRWIDSFGSTKVELGLPRFQFEYASSLKNVLAALGMGLAFDENRADFSGIRPLPPMLYFSEVKHKTFVQVNEKGTEAAAAFSMSTSLSLEELNKRMIVDRPFFFSIVDNVTGTIIFMGTVLEPKT